MIWLWAIAALAGGVALAAARTTTSGGGRGKATAAAARSFTGDTEARRMLAAAHDAAERLAALVVGKLRGDFPREGEIAGWEEIMWRELRELKNYALAERLTGAREALELEAQRWDDLADKVHQVTAAGGGMSSIVVQQIRVIGGAFRKTAGLV